MDTIEDLVLAEIRDFVTRSTFAEVVKNCAKIEKRIVKNFNKKDTSTGCILKKVRISDLAKCIHLNNINNTTYNNKTI